MTTNEVCFSIVFIMLDHLTSVMVLVYGSVSITVLIVWLICVVYAPDQNKRFLVALWGIYTLVTIINIYVKAVQWGVL